MKYLFLTFILLVLGLIIQIKVSEPLENPYADGKLVCLPVPPPLKYTPAELLPPPPLSVIPAVTTPAPVQAAKIEIFDPLAGQNRIAETQQDNQADWGISPEFTDSKINTITAALPTKIVQPVPVNPPFPGPSPLENLSTTESLVVFASMTPDDILADLLDEFTTDSVNTILARQADKFLEFDLPPLPQDDATSQAIQVAVETAAMNATSAPAELQPEPIQTASIAPVELRKKPVAPNLYLPEGALDESGAALTLIKDELHAYTAPDLSEKKSSFVLQKGEKIRPATRLRNADTYDWIKFDRDGESWWAQAEYFIRVDPGNSLSQTAKNLPFGKEKVDKNSALPIDYKPDDLTPVSQEHTFGNRTITLRKEAAEAFNKMASDAAKEGLSIKIFSGFRDFNYQARLYLETVEKQGPKQDGTAAPGHSEHQLGTTVDISNDNRRTILSGKFDETPEGRWLHNNSEKYGFKKSYTTENSEEVGYKPEPWHYRYMGTGEKSAGIARN